jgi:DNA primase
MDIEAILIEKGIEFTKSRPNEITLTCTSGEHEDNTPSLNFNTDQNFFHCFSCGFKGGPEKLLRSLDLEDAIDDAPRTNTSYKIKKLKRKLTEKLMLMGGIRKPEITFPFDFEFKGVSKETMREFGAFTTQELGLEDYICFPIEQYGSLRFIEGRYKLVNSDQKVIKYKRKPEGSKSIDILFPLDKVKPVKDTVVLVEGMFDMLNMWQYGFEFTLTVFGTNNFSKVTAEVLRDSGIKRVLLMMDADIAGYNAAKRIAEILDEENIEPIILDLRAGEDPGSMGHFGLAALLENYL